MAKYFSPEIETASRDYLHAIQSARPVSYTHLATYASRCIENEILMFLRKTNNIRNEISLDEPPVSYTHLRR